MFERVATIQSIDPDGAHVIVCAPATCERCAAGAGCGGGLLRTWSPHTAEVLNYRRTQLPAGLKIGDRVSLRVSERVFLVMALLVYGLPLALFSMAAVFLDKMTGLSEGYVALGACSALLVSYRIVAYLVRNSAESFRPVVCPGDAGA